VNAHSEPTQHVYVIKLAGPAGTAGEGLRGRLEHVASGRRHDFDSADALLDCLLHEERQLARTAIGASELKG
jgi:hypothetical protein